MWDAHMADTAVPDLLELLSCIAKLIPAEELTNEPGQACRGSNWGLPDLCRQQKPLDNCWKRMKRAES